jgi:hypothetical protein
MCVCIAHTLCSNAPVCMADLSHTLLSLHVLVPRHPHLLMPSSLILKMNTPLELLPAALPLLMHRPGRTREAWWGPPTPPSDPPECSSWRSRVFLRLSPHECSACGCGCGLHGCIRLWLPPGCCEWTTGGDCQGAGLCGQPSSIWFGKCVCTVVHRG